MKKKAKKQTSTAPASKKCLTPERRQNNRRLCEKKGFTYIPMVGWMCRRENTRRKDDNICGW